MEKILVVDDDDALRGMIKVRLSDTFETIDTAIRCKLWDSLWSTDPGRACSIS